MIRYLLFVLLSVMSFNESFSQNITYSEIEKADSRNMNFEILGNFSGNFLVYKNLNKRVSLTVYDNNMAVKETMKLDFISDRTFNIDFITYPDRFLMVWQFEKGNTIYSKAAIMNGEGKLMGSVMDLDTTKQSFFISKVYYTFTFSEDKTKLLLYKTYTRNNEYSQITKIYNDKFTLLDSSKRILSYNDNREGFGDLLIDNEGTILFEKIKQNAREEYINALEINFKKLNDPQLYTVNIPLNKQLVQSPLIKIDNLNKNYVINTFSYQKNGGNVDGLLSAVIRRDSLLVTKQTINMFDDSLRSKLSGKTDWRSAYNNLNIRNVILKRDGGFIILTEDYLRQRRYGSLFNDRFNGGFNNGFNNGFGNNVFGNNGFGNNGFYNSFSDYYLYNRGYYGYYRPFNDGSGRDIVYNYNDVINFSFSKDLKLQWNNVINKTTSDIENDNFLSFTNMNVGGEIHFLFLQKDNNRQILSNYAVQPDGSIKRYATLKGREAGYNFMPRLARQTGPRQMLVPCVVRNNIAFAKIDF